MIASATSIPSAVLAERRRTAEVLRHFASGRTTQFEFEYSLSKTPSCGFYDPVLDRVQQFAWLLYDDFKKHKLKGTHKLSRHERRAIARWILFLRSGYESIEGRPEVREEGTVSECALYLCLISAPVWAPIAIAGILWGVYGALIAAGVGFAFLFGLGVFLRVDDQIFACDQAFQTEEVSVWPFRSRDEFLSAVARPTFLAGLD